MSAHLDKLIEEVRALPPDEKRRLRQVIDQELPDGGAATQPTEEDFKHSLRKAGLLKQVKAPVTDLAPYRDRKPLEIAGQPLSETIIRERR